MFSVKIYPKTLHFKQPATTSRGSYTERTVWYVVMKHLPSGGYGVGECAPLPDLSCDAMPDAQYEELLERFADVIRGGDEPRYSVIRLYPSIQFGIETAFIHLRQQQIRFWNSPFSQGREGIPINGLVWMGSIEEMAQRMEEKVAQGFRCIKIKIGAQDFCREIELLAALRERFTPQELELRLDANGAFSVDEAMEKLEVLNAFDIHSIEQPIRQGQWDAMARLCQKSPIPIALDEELIGLNSLEEKERMLQTIRPQYVVIKPSLCGGIADSQQLYMMARDYCRGAWFTSALESNIGLNSIAQLASSLPITMPQGLGTGQLVIDNCPSPRVDRGRELRYDPTIPDPDLLAWLEG